MKLKKLKQIVKEEILIHKYGGVSLVNEEITNEDEDKIRKIIRQKFQQYFLNYLKGRSWEHTKNLLIETHYLKVGLMRIHQQNYCAGYLTKSRCT